MIYPSIALGDIPLPALQVFFMIFVRVMAILFMVPPFDNRSIPILVKGGLGLAISFVVYGTMTPGAPPPALPLISFCLAGMCELLRGVFLGICVRAVFAAVQLAGQMMGIQMGFAMANVMDPITQSQISVITQIKNLFAMLIFLALNGHHWFIKGMFRSFSIVPLFSFQVPQSLLAEVVRLGQSVFLLSIMMGAPVMAALLISSVALGLLARTVPQMNVFIMAFPMNIGVGLFFLMLSLPYIASILAGAFGGLANQVNLIMGAMP